jgi:phage terminase Nu1 subunit (DNA packaging protein)
MLNGWKEIATHLGRGIRTIQRWEKFGMPVYRPNGHSRSAVVADPDQVESWLRARTEPRSARLQRAESALREAAKLQAEFQQRVEKQKQLVSAVLANVERFRTTVKTVGLAPPDDADSMQRGAGV